VRLRKNFRVPLIGGKRSGICGARGEVYDLEMFRVFAIGRHSGGKKVWDGKFQGLSYRKEVGAAREANYDFLPTQRGLSRGGTGACYDGAGVGF
jgi:hypothetical protein